MKFQARYNIDHSEGALRSNCQLYRFRSNLDSHYSEMSVVDPVATASPEHSGRAEAKARPETVCGYAVQCGVWCRAVSHFHWAAVRGGWRPGVSQLWCGAVPLHLPRGDHLRLAQSDDAAGRPGLPHRPLHRLRPGRRPASPPLLHLQVLNVLFMHLWNLNII